MLTNQIMNKTYNELIMINNFIDRYKYLNLNGTVGATTFGSKRQLNQILYKTKKWLSVRDQVIIRDNGCDLGVSGYEIQGRLLVHHINPITIEDIVNENPIVFNLNNLITVSHMTHEAIHYGSEDLLPKDLVIRKMNDTCPWRHN